MKHRENKPAVESSQLNEWFRRNLPISVRRSPRTARGVRQLNEWFHNGVRHNLNGPAVIYNFTNSHSFSYFYVNGKEITLQPMEGNG